MLVGTINKIKNLVENILEVGRYANHDAVRRISNEEIDKRRVDAVECDVCGCLLKKETAIKGESTVHTTVTPLSTFPQKVKYDEKIVEHYFCKVHDPNIKRRKA